jgi:hypothetical protein
MGRRWHHGKRIAGRPTDSELKVLGLIFSAFQDKNGILMLLIRYGRDR